MHLHFAENSYQVHYFYFWPIFLQTMYLLFSIVHSTHFCIIKTKFIGNSYYSSIINGKLGNRFKFHSFNNLYNAFFKIYYITIGNFSRLAKKWNIMIIAPFLIYKCMPTCWCFLQFSRVSLSWFSCENTVP